MTKKSYLYIIVTPQTFHKQHPQSLPHLQTTLHCHLETRMHKNIQNHINQIGEWSKKWNIQFNTEKYVHIT